MRPSSLLTRLWTNSFISSVWRILEWVGPPVLLDRI